MKKIFKSVTMIAVLSLTAVAAKAQLSSDKAAMTPQQFAELNKKTTTTTPAPVAQSASDKPAMTPAQAEQLMKQKDAKPAAEETRKANPGEPGGVKVQASSETEVKAAPVTTSPVSATPATEEKKKK